MAKWGLSDKGFYRPNQNEIKQTLDERTREEFGANVNLNYKSPNGILNGIFSWFWSKIWEVAEKVYHSSQPSQATGVQLDYLTIFFGTTRRRPQYAMGVLKFTGDPFYKIPFGRLFEREDGVQYVLMHEVTLDNLGVGYGEATAFLSGVSGNAVSNTITIQVEPDSQISSVTNDGDFDGGAEKESDVELRKRLSHSYSALGSGTVNAIYADLLEIPGVRAVKIDVNEEHTPQNGLPAHSIGVYTYGGDENEIGNALMENYVGIQYFGTTSVNVKDLSGYEHTISYTKATITPVAFDVKVSVDTTFSAGGDSEIRNAIVTVVGGVDTLGNTHNGLNMGQPVVHARIIAAVMNIQGVTNANITMGTVASGTFTENDIIIPAMEVASTSVSEITVVHV